MKFVLKLIFFEIGKSTKAAFHKPLTFSYSCEMDLLIKHMLREKLKN